jgi:phosphoserine phosphatase RsbU/P
MTSNSLDNKRTKYRILASTLMQVGASRVQLLDGDNVLFACPDGLTDMAVCQVDCKVSKLCPRLEETELNALNDQPAWIIHSHSSNLSLQIQGLADEEWKTTVQIVFDMMNDLINADSEFDNITGALVETQDRLVALYDLTQATRRILDIPTLLDLLIKESKNLLNMVGGFAILTQKGKPSIIHQISDTPLPKAHVEAAAALFRHNPSRHTFKDSETLPPGLQNVLLVALPVRDEIFGVFGVFNKSGVFTSPDIKLAKAIADHIGAQLENAFLHKEAIERARLETELDLARQVQTALLPQSIPSVNGLDIYATSIPALEVGGDFFDLIVQPDKPFVFAIGDITGKGISSALLMAMTRTVARSATRNMPFTQPHQIMQRLNNDLFDDFSSVGMFTTALIGLFDPATRKLSFCNAGQSPIFYIPCGKAPILLEASDIPIGVLDIYSYISETIELSSGDIFVAATDGFPEARNQADEMFGYERIKDVIAKSTQYSAREITDNLLASVKNFSSARPQDDDCTIVVLKIK